MKKANDDDDDDDDDDLTNVMSEYRVREQNRAEVNNDQNLALRTKKDRQTDKKDRGVSIHVHTQLMTSSSYRFCKVPRAVFVREWAQ